MYSFKIRFYKISNKLKEITKMLYKCKLIIFYICFFAISIFILINCNNKKLDIIEASGILEAIEVNVASKLQALILELNFEEGDLIKKGSLLAKLDCTDYELQLNQFKANLDLLQAQYELVIKGARIEDIEQTDAILKQAESQYKYAEINYERISNLYEKNVVSKKLLDDAKINLDLADSQLKQAQQAIKKIKRLSRNEEIEMARARVEQAKWSLKLAGERVKDCEIISPIDGVVLKKVFEAGEYVMPGSTIALLTDLKKIRVIVYLPEADVFRIKYGQKVKVKVDAFKDKSFEGKVVYISSKAEFTPKNIQTKDERVKLMFQVKILVDNPEMILKPGLPADVEFVK